MSTETECCRCGAPAEIDLAGLEFLRDMNLPAVRRAALCDACHAESLSDAYREESEGQAKSLIELADLPSSAPCVPIRPDVLAWLRSQHAGAVFYGETGAGKTLQACALVREWIETTGTPALYRLEGDMFDKLSDFDHGNPREEFRKLNDAGLLIIDDVGTSKPTDHRVAEFFRVIDARYRHQSRRTVLITNMTPKKFANLELVDARVYRRLRDMCGGKFRHIDHRRGRRRQGASDAA